MQEIQVDTFREEAAELLAELENSLLELEDRPDDGELVDKVFRAMHTIKGSGAMFGFERIAEFTHEVETVFDQVREGHMQVSDELINLTLAARDRIIGMLENEQDEDGDRQAAEIIASLRALAPAGTEGAVADKKQENKPQKAKSAHCTYRIYFKPHRHLLTNGTNPIALLSELREMGQCTVVVHAEEIPTLDKYEAESCYCSWDIILTTTSSAKDIRDVFIFVEDDCELRIKVVDSEVEDEKHDSTLLGEILLDRGDITDQELNAILGERKKIGEVLVEAKAVPPDKVEAALLEQEHVRNVRRQRQEKSASSGIRVSSEKLDKLVDLVGELVTVQARLNQKAGREADSDLTMIAEDVERLTDELRDNTMSIRMLPIGTLFSKFRRLVRDLSKELGKEIEMEVEGAETELDKTVMERLDDPLVHLLRNSIDHGIEIPEERERIGKNRQGRIVFSAEHSGGNVIITISDDGRGIDTERVRTRAVEKGLLSPDSGVTEQDLLNLIFEPGFSTAEQVSDLSGRGVGMDVVRQNIAALKGKVRVSSEKGRGTTVRITLPLTLAIIEGLRIRIGREFFIIPLAVVSECLELERGKNGNLHQGRIINLRDQLVPVLRLRDWFSINGQKPEKEQVVVVSMEKSMVGLVADEVVGLQQTVIKNLDGKQKDVPGISGATIQGDGSIALILDVEPLIQKAEQKAFA